MSCTIFKLILLLGLGVALKADNDHGENSISMNKDSFKKTLTEKKMFVMFFAPWCGHCKRLSPTWDELAKLYNKPDSEITIAKVDCTEETALCADNQVSGYPTLKIFHKSMDGPTRYQKSRDLVTLKGFVEEQLAVKVEEKDPEWNLKNLKVLVDLTDVTFEKHIAMGNHFIMFFAPWCGHCKRLEPTWQELSNNYRYNDKVAVSRVDCTVSKGICTKYQVSGYPTLLWFSNGEKKEKYQNTRDLGSFTKFVDNLLENQEAAPPTEEKTAEAPVEAEEEEEKAGVVELTSDSFDSHIKTGYHFIKFYAPWCGHCKTLAPVWDDLANEMASNKKVSISKVDCTKHSPVCSKFGVRGYPTLLFFAGGDKVDQYQSARRLNELKTYVETTVALREKNAQEDDGKVPEDRNDQSDVDELTSEDFADAISEDYTFVKFYAPNCGHCRAMIPAWEELGKKHENDDNIMIANINCVEHTSTCQKYQVGGYPTLLLFRNGVQVEEYSGARTANSLSDWMMKIIKEKSEL